MNEIGEMKTTIIESLLDQCYPAEFSSVESRIDLSELAVSLLELEPQEIMDICDVDNIEACLDEVLRAPDGFYSALYVKRDWQDRVSEWADQATMIYNADLLDWLQDDRGEAVEEYLSEFGYNDEGFFQLLMASQCILIERAIYDIVSDWINQGIQEA